ncbi:Uncharacterised protein [uncultured archaeon]|nr:Uncharacterised protein [uncultured archaeon]
MRSKSFLKNEDAVAISLGFILTLAITVIVFTALIISFYSLTQSTEKSAMQDNFKIIGSGLAAKINSADMLANFTNSNSGTVNMLEYEFSVPISVAGKTYTINITKSPYKIIFETDDGVRVVSVFNASTNVTPVLLYSASEYFVIKYDQGSNSLYISSETLNPGEVAAMPSGVTNLNYTSGPLYINWTWTDPGDANFDHIELYVDSNPITTVGKGQQYFNASYFSPNSTHTIYIRTVDIFGYKNTTWVNLQARPEPVFTYVFDFLNTIGNVTNFPNAQNDNDGGASANFYEQNMSATPDLDNYTYVTSNITTNGTITNFANMQSNVTGAFANLTEGATISNTQYKWVFAASNESWKNSSTILDPTGAGTLDMLWNGSDGNPTGSLNATLKAKTSNPPNNIYSGMTMWKSPNFSWNSGTPTSANISFDFKVATFLGNTGTNNYSIFLKKFDGTVVLINSTNIGGTSGWTNYNYNIGTNNFTGSGNYSLMLNATLTTQTKSGVISIGWDNPTITLNYTSYNLNIITNTTNIPSYDNYYLEINYSRDSNETGYNVSVFNGSGWNYKGNLTNSTWSLANFTLSNSEVINGNVSVQYTDMTPTGTKRGNLSIDYQRIHGFTAGLPAGDYLDITTNTTNIPKPNTSSVLQLKYYVSADNFTILIKNGTTSGWDTVSTLNNTSTDYRNITLTQNELLPDGTIPGGNMPAINKYYVLVRYKDESSSKNGTLNIDYQRIYSS